MGFKFLTGKLKMNTTSVINEDELLSAIGDGFGKIYIRGKLKDDIDEFIKEEKSETRNTNIAFVGMFEAASLIYTTEILVAYIIVRHITITKNIENLLVNRYVLQKDENCTDGDNLYLILKSRVKQQ